MLRKGTLYMWEGTLYITGEYRRVTQNGPLTIHARLQVSLVASRQVPYAHPKQLTARGNHL